MPQNQNVYDGLVIRDNVLLGRYVVRAYLNGDLFGTDQKLLTGADKNGVREKLSAFFIALEERNDCGALYPDPAAHETPFVQGGWIKSWQEAVIMKITSFSILHRMAWLQSLRHSRMHLFEAEDVIGSNRITSKHMKRFHGQTGWKTSHVFSLYEREGMSFSFLMVSI